MSNVFECVSFFSFIVRYFFIFANFIFADLKISMCLKKDIRKYFEWDEQDNETKISFR